MKPITFLRKALRKEKPPPKNSSVDVSSLDIPPPSPFQKKDTRGNTSMLSLDIQSTLQPEATKIRVIDPLGTIENTDSFHAVPGLRGKLFQSTVHGPPKNTAHGPGFLNFSNPPPRPSRPPSLNLPSPPPSPLQRSPTRVRFAPETQVKTSLPPSPLRQAFLPAPSQDNTFLPAFTSKGGRYEGTKPHNRNVDSLYLTQSTSTARAVLDLTDSPNHREFARTNSSSPHLPSTKFRPRTEPQLQREKLSSQDTLALFPVPPRSSVRPRRRPQPLVLLPTPTIAPLPPSPLNSSTDSTPLSTPTATSVLPSPRSSKFSTRPLHGVTPPRYSPPSGPLPTPPNYSSSLSPSGKPISPKPGKTLRVAQSTSGLREHSFDVSYGIHRATSSAPCSNTLTRNDLRQRVESTPSLESESSLVGHESGEISNDPSHVEPDILESRIQWGYAF
ncbi:hypothetical protein H0H92_013808 [Tricholoma furcatifolium]|nr:hypothetical protein H0H92_013808 [Tricholoma furcatifolium]